MSLEQALAVALEDALLADLLACPAVSLSVWWLEADDDASTGAVLYAWVIPTSERPLDAWVEVKQPWRTASGVKHRTWRSNVVLAPSQATQVVRRLALGDSLGTACDECSVPKPGRAAQVGLEIAKYCVPPAIYLPSHTTLPFAQSGTSRRSPSNRGGAYCVRLQALELLPSMASRSGFELEEFLPPLLKWLDDETGLGFAQGASSAIGSIEFLSFPSLSPDEQPRVLVSDRNGEVSVEVAAGPGKYLARLGAESCNDVVFDLARELTGSPPRAVFSLPREHSGFALTIFRSSPAGWTLFHEERRTLVREISTTISLMGLTGELHSDWLTKLGTTKASSRARELSKIHQVAHGTESRVSTWASWELATKNARDVVARLFPHPSSGQFFAKGWEGDVPGRLALAEWLKKELSSAHGGNLVLIDPYFDTFGVELFARAAGSAGEMVVLTNTQVGSQDDNQHQRPRAERLRLLCKQLAPFLEGLGFRLLDLRSSSGDQLFHDRLLLASTKDGRVSRGFSLSNSIQGATKRAPLLVTPIPDDVLPAVAEYVARLVNGNVPDVPSATVERLYPPDRLARADGFDEILPKLALLAEALFGTPRPPTDDVKEAGRALERAALVDLKQQRCQPLSNDKFAEALAAICGSSVEDGKHLWCGVAEWLARSQPEPQAAPNVPPGVGPFLAHYLTLAPQWERPLGMLGAHTRRNSGVAHLFSLTFVDALRQARLLLEHHHGLLDADVYSVRYAAAFLVKLAPPELEKTVGALVSEGDGASGVLSTIVGALVEAAHTNPAGAWVAVCADSSLDFLRAFAAQVWWQHAYHSGGSVRQFCQRVETLPAKDQPWVLAEAIHERRILANRARHGGRQLDPDPALDALFSMLANCFVAVPSDADVDTAIALLSGPIAGSWSASTDERFIGALVSDGKLDVIQAFAAWDRLVHSRMDTPGDHRFFAPTDLELSQTWADALARVDEQARRATIESVVAESEKLARVMRRPFQRSRDYATWGRAAERFLWRSLLLARVVAAARSDEQPRLNSLLTGQTKTLFAPLLDDFHGAELRDAARAAAQTLDVQLKATSELNRSTTD